MERDVPMQQGEAVLTDRIALWIFKDFFFEFSKIVPFLIWIINMVVVGVCNLLNCVES